MRLLRIAATVILAAASGLGPASPAQAGGWATTLLDPLPERLEPGQAYTVGYWVLQHGSHPYEGDLGETALRLTNQDGVSSTYVGTRLPEAGHYAAAVVLGRPGTWRLTSVQGVFADYEIGAFTVPGGIRVQATPTPMAMHEHGTPHWGEIRPPLAAELLPPAAIAATSAPATATPPSEGGPSVRGPVLAGAVAVALGLTLLTGRRLSRARGPRHTSEAASTRTADGARRA